MTARAAWLRLRHAWEAVQVELHGQYSLHRLRFLHEYIAHVRAWRVCAVVLVAPLPCLIAVAVADSIPMAPPDEGLHASLGFWVRCHFATFVYSQTIISQVCYYVPRLEMSLRTQLAVSVPATVLTCAATYVLAHAIGFPVPFTIPMTATPWSLSMTVCIALVRGKFLWHHRDVARALLQYSLVLVCQMSMVIIYPLFYTIFSQLSSSSQPAMALVLPVIKLIEKNVLSKVIRNSDDAKPEIVVFNIEIFNALFVSCCMQSSTSLSTNLVIMAADFVQACASVQDLNVMLGELNVVADKIAMPKGRLIDTAMEILQSYPSTASHHSFHSTLTKRVASSSTVAPSVKVALPRMPVHVHPAPHAHLARDLPALDAAATTATSVQPPMQTDNHDRPESRRGASTQAPEYWRTDSVTRTTAVSSAGVHPIRDTLSMQIKRAAVETLSADERLVFVQKSLKVLYLTEFVLLVEFTEVMIPIVYCIYLVALFHLPNRAFYPQLRAMDELHLVSTIQNVVIYAAMELFSFAVLYVVLKRKLHLSAIHQLAFVLEKQWTMVQAKLVLWVVFMLQSTLLHLGADYSFKFAWLHPQRSVSESTPSPSLHL